MLLGFECDKIPTGWLAGSLLWATGAGAGCLLAVATSAPALSHWQTLALAVGVSLLSLGLRLPVLWARCSVPAALIHAVWLLTLLAQVNWAGFLAVRSASGTVAAEALLICLVPEVWLTIMFVANAKLPWLTQLFRGVSAEAGPTPVTTIAVGDPEDASLYPETGPIEYPLEVDGDAEGDIRREFVDGIDENGERYLSGCVRLHFDCDQRSDIFVLSFCPALDGVAEVELECDSEDVQAKVEHATETGARVAVRRQTSGEAITATIDWYAKASTADPRHSMNLP